MQDFGRGGFLFRLDELEPTRDAKFVLPGANEFGRAALAEQEADGPEEKGFARAGFPSPGAEARGQFDPDIFDEGEILHGQFTQHAGMVPKGAEDL